MRPRARPESMMKKKKAATSAPMSSMRPKARPKTMVTPEEAGAIERGNRAAKRRADEAMPMMKSGGALKMVEKDGKKVPFYAADGKGAMKKGGKVKKMKSGGKVRGYGMARGGKVCKMR